MQAWNLVFGTEEVLKEERHRDRLNVLDRNPLLLHAWYTTCKDAGVPVRNIEGKTEEQAVEVLRQVSHGRFHDSARQVWETCLCFCKQLDLCEMLCMR